MNGIRLSLLTLLFTGLPVAAQGLLQLRGQVTDPSKAAIPAATVTLTGDNNFNRTAQTDEQGRYTLTGLQPGKYVLRIVSTGFATYERRVDLSGDRPINFDIALKLAVEQQQVTVSENSEIALDPSDPTKNVGALVLKGEDLQILSDNPDDLANDLQALAGPSVGPNGGQIFIDGFSGGRLPPKESIREVRINSNPFSSEYDKPGFGRIEILTKPGTDKLHGSGFFNFTDDVFNSRNPYSTIRPPYQQRFFGGHLSGALSKKLSFFVDAERRNQDETSVINAVTLDPNFNPFNFSTAILNPTTRNDVSTRLDYQLNANNTLAGRYRWFDMNATNEGLTALTLPSRAYDMSDGEHTMQLTETAVLGAKAISETRFRYEWDRTNQNGDSSMPAIQVLDSFTGGGAPFSVAYNNQNSWELGNTTSITHGPHMLKIGGRLRGVTVDDFSTQNYNGTYTFSSLTAYQLQLEGMTQGLSNEQIRAMGGGPMQFTLTGGEPLAGVSQYDIGVFFQDDWRIKPNFTLSTGLRYETQNNISSNLNFAPRIGFAWGIGKPGGMMRAPKLVVRGGWGIFYDRFDENFTLNARRQNGILQQLFTVQNPNFCCEVPTVDQLQPFAEARTIQQVYSGLSTPYLMQTTIGIERQFPKNITVAVNYANSRGVHQLRARNINAPLPGTFDPTDTNSGVYPYGRDAGNVYLYEASGSYRQNQLMTNVRAPINSKLMLFGFYVLNYANSDTDGGGAAAGSGPPGAGRGGGGGGAPNLTFPANTYDLSTEWGRARFDIRHRFVLGGNIVTWRGVTFNPFIIAMSGAPFNITLGSDLNGDNQFTERPALAAPGATGPNIVPTPFGVFNVAPGLNDVIIPRNYGDGPGQFMLNLRVSKTWGWGERASAAAGPDGGPMGGRGGMVIAPGGGPPPGGGGGRGGGGMPGGGRMGGGGGGPFGGGSSGRKYSLTFSASARNLLNHVNPGMPIGTLTSTLFGESNQLAGGFFATSTANRRIDLQLRFSF